MGCDCGKKSKTRQVRSNDSALALMQRQSNQTISQRFIGSSSVQTNQNSSRNNIFDGSTTSNIASAPRVAQINRNITRPTMSRQAPRTPVQVNSTSLPRKHRNQHQRNRTRKSYHKNTRLDKYQDTRIYRPIKSSVKVYDFSGLTNDQIKSWERLHTMASIAVTTDSKTAFKQYLDFVARNYPCRNCRFHMLMHMKANPIHEVEVIIENQRDVGMSKWAWEYHNAVNQKLRQPLMSWEDYSAIYLTN